MINLSQNVKIQGFNAKSVFWHLLSLMMICKCSTPWQLKKDKTFIGYDYLNFDNLNTR